MLLKGLRNSLLLLLAVRNGLEMHCLSLALLLSLSLTFLDWNFDLIIGEGKLLSSGPSSSSSKFRISSKKLSSGLIDFLPLEEEARVALWILLAGKFVFLKHLEASIERIS